MNLPAIEALWFEQGTAADAAMAANRTRPHIKWVSPATVKRIWANAQKAGRLPPFTRPHDGFPPGPSSILKRFMMIEQGKAA